MAGQYETSASQVSGKYMTPRAEQMDLIPRRTAEMRSTLQRIREAVHRRINEAEAAKRKERLGAELTHARSEALEDFLLEEFIANGPAQPILRASYRSK